MKFIILFLLVLLSHPSMAQTPLMSIKSTPRFGLPIDCTPTKDCWVMNYVDYGADDDKKTDAGCLARTYDGHKGTDFALLDGATMGRGVNVLAAADGTITRLRDSEKDAWHSKEELEAIRESRKECGNGIFIDHGNGVETVYCHLKLNSITVEKNQSVKKGDVIAQVGQSGLTEFPHLHFGIIKDGKILDPFTGGNNDEECGLNKKSLWEKDLDLSYQPLVIQSAAFLNKVPDFKVIEREAPVIPNISTDDNALVFWVTLLGVREGDRITMEIIDPNGKIFATRTVDQAKTRARQYYFIGKNINKDNMLEGAYTASLKVMRGGESWSRNEAILVSE